VSTIDSESAIYVDFQTPSSQLVEVKVAARMPVNVFAMRKDELDAYLAIKSSQPAAIAQSLLEDEHRLRIQLPPVEKWFLVIENPWKEPVEAKYAVSALSPTIGADIASYSFSPGVLRYEADGATGSMRGRISASFGLKGTLSDASKPDRRRR
jgi:hypothetical protein